MSLYGVVAPILNGVHLEIISSILEYSLTIQAKSLMCVSQRESHIHKVRLPPLKPSSALPKSSGRVITLYRNTILPTSGNSNRSRPQTNYKCLQSYYSSSLSCAQDQNVSVTLCCLQWLLGYISAIMGRLP